jgi:chromosome segregation ATPase
LSKKLETQDETLEGLQNKVTAAQEQSAAAARTYTEAIDGLREVQNKRDQAEKQEEKLNRLIKDLEEENAFVNNRIRHMKMVNSQAEQRTDALEKAIAELSEQLSSANQRTLDAENAFEDLGIELSALEEEANDLQLKGQKLQKQIDIMQSTMRDA